MGVFSSHRCVNVMRPGFSRLSALVCGLLLPALLGVNQPLRAQPTTIDQSANLELSGTGGGPEASDCGFLPSRPSQVLRVTEGFVERSGFLRLAVSGGGQATLLIEGPTGRLCAMASGDCPAQHAGVWLAGTYRIYIGDRQGGSFPYRLSISGR